MNLGSDDFAQFFEELWGCEPFPWQARLARTVGTSGWPAALDLPTASGKTAAIDIALFHLALQADYGPQREAPVRILFVVDRRLVVDSAFDRALRIAERLAGAENGVLKIVADRLRRLSGEHERPLRVVRLRGGTPQEPDWVRSPSQPTVVVSTVDQVGSRLLFRGYGVSTSMRPVHAGLIGSDALCLLDEAHLSQPFLETLGWIERYRKEPWAEHLVGPFGVVHLSATLAPETGEPFRLDDNDREHGVLGPRLRARKHARLEKHEAGLAETDKLASAFATHAQKLVQNDGVKVVAVVVNRVALARAVFELLEKKLTADAEGDEADPADVVLLTGRIRPLDRDRLLASILPRMRAGRETEAEARPLFVVATQCIEAGADLDFDALVTQIAPLDALRQRFGRLDRLGRRGQSKAVIVAAKGEVDKKSDDPIYGHALAETWRWLGDHADGEKKKRPIDFGIQAMAERLTADGPDPKVLAPRTSAPVMLPAYVDAFVQTSPPPGADPEVSLFLHGPDSPAEVQIVWRADPGDHDLEQARSRVATCPPSSLEALSVPIAAARRWLLEEPPAELADVEGAGISDGDSKSDRSRKALRWRGPDEPETKPVEGRDLRPGDLLVVTSAYGGCDAYGWNPQSHEPVPDLGFEASLRHRRRLLLRLDAALVRNVMPGERESAGRLWRRIADHLERWHDDPSNLATELAGLDDLPGEWARALDVLSSSPRRALLELRDPEQPGKGGVLSLRRRLDDQEVARILGEGPVEAAGHEAATEDDAGLGADQPVGLEEHCAQVADIAAGFAGAAGLPAERVRDITLAARLHDLGKAEERFQILLRRGDELAWEADRKPLAKSTPPMTRQENDRARRQAGLPKGARHECCSLALAERLPQLGEADDPDLVLWLIGTHHGHGRPFFPPVRYPDEGERLSASFHGRETATLVGVPPWRLDSGWIERFERLKRRYGPWELARMEAILRLADHRGSQAAPGEEARSLEPAA